MNIAHHLLCRSVYWRGFVQRDLLPWAIDDADFGEHLLEIGPGPGLTTDILRSRATRLTAVEIDPKLSASLADRLRNTNVTVLHCDASEMPFPDCSVDSAVCFTMLHHVPSRGLQDKLLREVRRVLKPGALFIGTDSIQSWLLRLIHIGDTFVPVDPGSFSSRLAAAGFDSVSVESRPHSFRFSARRPSETNATLATNNVAADGIHLCTTIRLQE